MVELPFGGEAPMPMTQMDMSMLRAQIQCGNMDEMLDWIEELVKDRRLMKARERLADLTYGAEMRLNDRIRPQLLQFAQVKFISWVSLDEMRVELKWDVGRSWRRGVSFKVSASQIGELVTVV